MSHTMLDLVTNDLSDRCTQMVNTFVSDHFHIIRHLPSVCNLPIMDTLRYATSLCANMAFACNNHHLLQPTLVLQLMLGAVSKVCVPILKQHHHKIAPCHGGGGGKQKKTLPRPKPSPGPPKKIRKTAARAAESDAGSENSSRFTRGTQPDNR